MAPKKRYRKKEEAGQKLDESGGAKRKRVSPARPKRTNGRDDKPEQRNKKHAKEFQDGDDIEDEDSYVDGESEEERDFDHDDDHDIDEDYDYIDDDYRDNDCDFN